VNGRPGLTDGRLRLAIPNKGRLAEPAIALLREAGYQFEADDRRLFAPCENYPLDLLFVRAEDIPEYTGDGVVDLGITGSNLVEERGSPVTQGMPLGFGHCRLRVAVPDERPFRQVSDLAGRPVATSHPRTTARFFKDRGVPVELIEISGAVEIAPLLGVADAIVDLVSTGSTLAVNGLRPIETILESEAQLISHPRLSPDKSALRRQLETMFASVIAARRKKYVMMNAPAGSLALIKNVIPGMQSPTVMPLADPEMIAVHAVVDADAVWALLGPLKAAGATSILVMPIEKLIP
jgi:ATP phosphoribosyltransferase